MCVLWKTTNRAVENYSLYPLYISISIFFISKSKYKTQTLQYQLYISVYNNHIYTYIYIYTEWTYIDTRESGGLRHGDVSAPAARRMVRTLLWPPLPHRTLANIGPLCPSRRPLPLCLVACPLSSTATLCFLSLSLSSSTYPSLVDSLFLRHSVSRSLSSASFDSAHLGVASSSRVTRVPRCLVIF